jgi:hypothetical protein
MKAIMLGTIAAVTVAFAMPAAAQIRVETPVGGVRIGDGPRDYPRYRAGVDAYASCKTIKTRTVLPNGRVIVERKEVCR